MRRRDRLAAFNERAKLAANSVNAVGLAFIGLGFVRPIVDTATELTWNTAGYLATGLALHAVAHYIVGQVETDT